MIRRRTGDKRFFISQTAHAWLSGQLAEAWGNAEFGHFKPRPELCLAAGHHDIGWMEWEQHPSWNPETGFPYDFMNMPVEEHLAIWSSGSQRMGVINRYAALMVALHNAFLAGIHDFSNNSEAEEKKIRDFYLSEKKRAESLKKSLGAVPAYQPYLEKNVMERNRRLIGTWDYLSLLLCMGVTDSDKVPGVPLKGLDNLSDVEIESRGDDRFVLHPWPFGTDEVSVACEAIRLEGPNASQQELDRDFAAAKRELLRFRLKPS